MQDASTCPKCAFTIRRRFAAPRPLVFDSFVEPARLVRWFGPPGYSTPDAQVDLRVGGAFRLTLVADAMPDVPLRLHGRYLEIDPPNRLVFHMHWEGPELDPIETHVTVELADADGETELVLTHVGFPSAELAATHQNGWTGCFGKLDQAV